MRLVKRVLIIVTEEMINSSSSMNCLKNQIQYEN